MVKLMLEGTYNCKELSEMTGLHYVTVLQYTRYLHKAKAAHICMWEKDTMGRDLVKIYKIGAGQDARRSKMTPVERSKRYRDKQRALKMMHMIGGANAVS